MTISNDMRAVSPAEENGLTLIELLIAMVLLVAITGGFYALVVTADRGWSLLQGQLETQQATRLAIERIMSDLREATDYSTTNGQLVIQETTILTCPASAGTTQILVQDAQDIQVNSTITLQALSTREAGKTVTAIGPVTTCAANGASGAPLTLSPALMNSFPYGAVISPIPVTYSVTPASPGSPAELLRNGAVVASGVSASSFSQPVGTLAVAVPPGATSILLTIGSTSTFAPGDVIFIDSGGSMERRTVTGLSIGPLTLTLSLDTGLFYSHPLGVLVRKKVSTVQFTGQLALPAAGGNQVQQITLLDMGGARN